MIHADVFVAGTAEGVDRPMQDIELDLRQRDIDVIDHSLALETLRQVRVVVDSESVWTHGDNGVQRGIETFD